ncbi:thioredoxin family protein [Verrucomicrobia bacterium]|nr:thioredoxin family protein [Verrucomicrobiota bacterium]
MKKMYMMKMLKQTAGVAGLAAMFVACAPQGGDEGGAAPAAVNQSAAPVDITIFDSGTGQENYEGGWITDVPSALKIAKEQNKLVLMDFTGSDWCPPCKMLHMNVLTSVEFEALAKDNFVLVELDFPQRVKQTDRLKDANAKLSEHFGIEGFPTVIVVDPELKQVFRQTGYAPLDEYLGILKKDLGI